MLPILLAPLLQVVTVLSPFGDAPAAQPAVAISEDGAIGVVAVWEKRLVWTASADGGKTWSPASTIAPELPVPGALRRGPRLAAPRGVFVVTTPRAKHGSNDIVALRSEDGGKTWAGPVRVNDEPDSAREGFHDLALSPEGALFVAWLDDRRRRGSQEVFSARSEDGGKSWSRNALVYASPEGTVCECCPVAVGWGKGGPGVVFRNWLQGARDSHLVLSRDGGATFEGGRKLGAATWKIFTCPMAEGAVAFEGENPVAVSSSDGRLSLVRADGSEVEIGRGEHPALAAGGGSLYLAYRDRSERRLVARRIENRIEKGKVGREIPLPPEPAQAKRDFPVFATNAAGAVVLAFEERRGQEPPVARLALLAR